MDSNLYQSPYSWRYSSPEMREIWSETHKRRSWRKLWLDLAEVQASFGLVEETQLSELRAHVNDLNIERSLEIENEIHHDLMAELICFSEQCPAAGGILHAGATSMDIVDNTDALRVLESLQLIKNKIASLLITFIDKIELYAEQTVMGFTHLQAAEPSTLGYRLAQYAQDILEDYEVISTLLNKHRAKGFRGAVGTGAAFAQLIGENNIQQFEAMLSKKLGLPFFTVCTQTYPRKQDYNIIAALAGLAASIHKFALDLRILQSAQFAELSESFEKTQVGSSAMPFKKNPIKAEKLNSLGRLLAQMPRLAWDNAANSMLERSLDDSANRRSSLAESFLIADEMLIVSQQILSNLEVNSPQIEATLTYYGPFAGIEKVLMALVQKGADRQMMHETLKKEAMAAWEAIRKGRENPLAELLQESKVLARYLSKDEIYSLLETQGHTGVAAQQSHALIQEIKIALRKWS